LPEIKNIEEAIAYSTNEWFLCFSDSYPWQRWNRRLNIQRFAAEILR